MYVNPIKVITRRETRGPLMQAHWNALNADTLNVVDKVQVKLLEITGQPHRATQDCLEAATRDAHVADIFASMYNLNVTRD